MTWIQARHRGYWEHRCEASGKILVVTRQQLGIYRAGMDEDEPASREKLADKRDRWEIDFYSGCQWCQQFPPELEPLAEYLKGKLPG